MPACAVVMSPWLDLSLSGGSHVENLRRDATIRHESTFKMLVPYVLTNGAHAQDPAHSPLFGDWKGFPPILFMVGETERLRDDSVEAVPMDCEGWEQA